MDFDTTVKMKLYEMIAGRADPLAIKIPTLANIPTSIEVAQVLGVPLEDVAAVFERLHKKRLLVPEPGDPTRIRMAPPFSGVETPFKVRVKQRTFFANCAWDSLGIAAALHEDAIIDASDAATGEPITLEVKLGQPVAQECAIHFVVPAAKWWEDIIYT